MTRRGFALGLVALASLVAAACGSGSNPADAKAVAGAAARTSSVRSYDLSTNSKVKLPGTAQPVVFSGIGAFDTAHHRGKLALDFTPLTPVTGRNLGTMLLVLDGATLYVKLPVLRQLNPRLKPWLKMNLEQSAQAQGVDFSAFLAFGQGGDPSQILEYLRGSGGVKKVGSDRVRGVSTTHYTATIDLKKVAKQAPARVRAQVRRAIDSIIRLTGQKTLPVDAWLDGQGRVRRIKYRQKLTLGSKRTEVAQAMELYDFGTPVVIQIPPRDEVTDLTTAGGTGGGG